MLKPLIAFVVSLPIAAAALPPARAEVGAPEGKLVQTQFESSIVLKQKTSDRTPNVPAPKRTQGANMWGAAGVDGARTPFGTSDRTPENHYRPATD